MMVRVDKGREGVCACRGWCEEEDQEDFPHFGDELNREECIVFEQKSHSVFAAMYQKVTFN